MKIELAKFIKEVCDFVGNQECEIRERYAGRGMFGEETAAVVINSPTILICDLMRYFADNLDGREYVGMFFESDFVSSLRMDNMGRDNVILY